MEELIIKGTDYSPEVVFSPKNSTYSISGWSRPESPFKFYEQVFKWIEDKGVKFLNNATIDFKIEYFNTPSAKMIRHMFEKLDLLYQQGVKMNVVWYYDDVESKEEFEYEFAQGLGFPIKYIEKKQ
ncbi:MAG: DUF1987 domain-containing protein [Bacteroidetes bacterium]|nr:DUF1987 domain-containing protein [Bacteroidota bacterium]